VTFTYRELRAAAETAAESREDAGLRMTTPTPLSKGQPSSRCTGRLGRQ
jgi:hypothetical protein